MTLSTSLYIHWPFCLAKCPYCDFNSHVLAADEDLYVAGLLTELNYWAARLSEKRPLSSIFFGGGTPSLLSPRAVSTLIEEAQKLFAFVNDIEITLEANPTSSEAEKFSGFHAAGVNRLSLGVQALDDNALKTLGRQHNVAEALKAVEMAGSIFPRTSFDLIYARKGQSLGEWEKELARALQVARGHLSLYQLTIEPGTVFARQAATGTEHRAEDDIAADMYTLTQEMTKTAGLPAYEVSNHAKPGEECRHNMGYWDYDDYIGIGPGAHGRVRVGAEKFATACLKPPQQWLKAAQEQGHGMEVDTPLTRTEILDEALLMGLRLSRGIDKKMWEEKFGAALDEALNLSCKAACLAEGLLQEDDDYLHASAEGMLKLTALTAALSKD